MKKKALSLIIIFIMMMSLVPVVQIKDTHASVGASINKKSVTLFVNQKYQLKLSGTELTKVASSNKKIVVVNSKGLIKGVKAGKAIISLKGSNGKIYKCSVTVKNPYISKTSLSIIKGKTYGLKLYGTSIKSVATSNKKIATISKNGVVKGVEKGYCYVYIKGTNNKVYKCKVEVTLHVHKWIKTKELEPTCYHAKIIYYKCKTCNKTKETYTGEKLEHKWKNRTKISDATCLEPPMYAYTCELCNYNKYEFEGETVDHQWHELGQDLSYIFYTCRWCNEVKKIPLS